MLRKIAIRKFLLDSSIFFKISGLFVFALLSFLGFSFYFIRDQTEQEHIREELRYRYFLRTLAPIVRDSGDLSVVLQYLDEFGFALATDPKIKNQLINTNKLPPIVQGIFAKTLKIEDKIYILLETPNEALLFKYSPKYSFANFYLVIFLVVALLVLMLVMIFKALAPLKCLHSSIKKFSNGELDISCRLEQKDEIGELAQEFDNAVSKIRALNESRMLFLRSIMHELNTPITKGRLISAMLEEGVAKERLTSVFKRFEVLIKEFAKLEQMNAKAYKMHKREFLLDEVVNEAKTMLLIDNDDQIIVQSHGDLIKADFELFALVLKNLFDNAIKYGSDKKVYVKSVRQNLYVSNRGDPLKANFVEYFKPYFKEDNSQGFGLGLYIIKSVLEAQKFGIDYVYQDGFNCFIISDCIVENR
ncbi:ArsS family sensor histidine kinase [Helicobacter pametensis]|uniref:ArsS family sensor histidine kinase n=1 Tax=Helicobacter pametensis TaxID=95149 RepID=UPI0004ACD66E|nr:ArsS family sensor histidine kinase [Helicobacter pametensis]